MPHLKILNQNDKKDFDDPPKFNREERKRFFYLPNWSTELVESFRTPTNKVGFVLQFGYFKAINRFFVARKFHQKDIEFIAKRFGIRIDEIDLNSYKERNFIRHQEIICENMGFQRFDKKAQNFLQKEAIALASKQIKPRLMFMSLVDFLRNRKIEVPSYYTFAEIITDALKDFERSLIETVKSRLSIDDRQLLDRLLEVGEEYTDGEKQDSKIKRYKITLLKKSNQSTRPSKIKANIQDLQCLENLFKKIEPLIDSLNLSSELIQYYAQVVIKSRGFQMNRRESRRYLLLIAFVTYQYYQLNDILTEVLMQSVQSTLNTSERDHKENFYNQRKEKHKIFSSFSKKMTNHLVLIKQARTILQDQILSADEKVKTLQSLFSEDFDKDSIEIQSQLTRLGKESSKITKNIDYYDLLEAKSIKLQNRVSEIVKSLQFDPETSDKSLIQAIELYKQKDGNISNNAPIDFLDAEEQEILFDFKDKMRGSLYKVLLFTKVADAIRSGALNLKYSYKYRTFDDYLIPQKVWESNKQELLEKAGLSELQNFEKLENQIKEALQKQFKITNENIINGVNKYVTVQEDGSLKVKTPKQDKEMVDSETGIDLFPKNRVISLFEVLSTVNQVSNFTDCFEHWQVKHNRDKPSDKTFFAGIIGYGCNLGYFCPTPRKGTIRYYE